MVVVVIGVLVLIGWCVFLYAMTIPIAAVSATSEDDEYWEFAGVFKDSLGEQCALFIQEGECVIRLVHLSRMPQYGVGNGQ